MTRPLIFFILILEGFITISIEILAIRNLIPFVGNSVVITSLIIGVFLLFLSIGYWKGGTQAADFELKLSQNFFWAATIVGIGFSFYFVSYCFWFSLKYLSLSYLAVLTLYLLLVVAPTVYLLGQTIPITTNLFNNNKTISTISGNALFINTLGSFLGAVLTSLVLLHFFGVALTIFINCIFMLLLSYILKRNNRTDSDVFILIGLVILIYQLNINYESFTFIKTNEYGNYQVRQADHIKTMKINFANMSTLSDDKKGAAYIEKIKTILFHDMKLKNNDILVIGAGGFTLSAEGEFGNHITYLDIDSQIKQLAETSFLEAPIQGQFLFEDARIFFYRTGKPYDVIISDAYKNLTSLPTYLLTQEYFKQIHARLKTGGLAIFNVIASTFLEDNYSSRMDNTLLSVFKHCMKMPLSFDRAYTNILYICKKSSYQKSKSIYTDNLNQATWDQLTSPPS